MEKNTLLKFRSLSLFLFASVLINYSSYAQLQSCGILSGPNLIPNPSFEDVVPSVCGGVPESDELHFDKSPVQAWFGLSKYCPAHNCIDMSPQYSNTAKCGTRIQSCACTPTNPTSGTGSVAMNTKGSLREAFQAKLDQPLIAGHQYCFSLKVPGNCPFPATSDGLGVWFHDKGFIDIRTMNNNQSFIGPGSLINATPQIENPKGNILGGSSCKTISGTFCAKGGEQYIVISNFRTDANTTVTGMGSGISAGLLMIDELSLRENNKITITSISTTADSVCPGSCATLKANVSGGNGSYTYKWSPGGETTESISACPTVDKTKYKCTVSSSQGCAVASSIADSVTIFFKKYIPVPTITTSTSSTICSGDTITLTCTPAAPNYKWSTGATTQSIKVTTAGLYSVTVKHTYSGCNSTSAATNVVVNNLPVLVLGNLKNDSTSCDIPTGSIKGITATGAAPITYSWNSNPVQTTPELINVGPGLYTLTVTDGNGCKKTTTATISNKQNPPAPTIDLTSSTTTVCSGSDIKLAIKNPDPTYTFTWMLLPNKPVGTGPTLTIKNATPADAGVYSVTATKFGCTGSGSTINITVNQTPDTVVVKAVAPQVCEGTKAVLFVNPPADPNLTYTWKSPDPLTPNVINDSLIIEKAKLTDAGTYTVTATKNNCASAEVHPKLVVDTAAIHEKVKVSANIICQGDSVTINAANYIPGVTYNIYTQASGGTPIGVAPLKVFPPQTTIYYMEAKSSKGCSQLTERDTVTVNVYKAPDVPPPIASNMTICEGKTTVINVQSPLPGNTYQVYDALTAGKLLGSTPLTVTLTKTTTFYIEAVSSQGCKQVTGRLPITIKVNPTPAGPKITVENQTGNYICDGSSAKLISSITSGITWSTGEKTPSIVVTKAGTYAVYYTDVNGCASLKDSVQITIKIPPKVDASNFIVDTVRCNATIGGIHGVVINSGTAPFTYKWFETSNPTKILSTDLILQGVASGKYTLVVTDKNSCEDRLSNVFIPSKGGIIANLSGTPTTGVAPLSVDLKASTSGVGKPIDYVWVLDGRILGTTNSQTNTYSIKDLPFGEHVMLVTVRDTNGCKSVDYLKIFVHTPIHIIDVNIFTPNNDGHNDILVFPSKGVQSMHVKIYDRWGLKLYEWADPDKGWNGNSASGEAVPEGTYYYIIDYVDYYGNTLNKAGYVQLMRN